MAHLTVTLSEQEQALLHSIAQETHRSDEEVASEAVAGYVRFRVQYVERVKAGIEAADRGDLVTEEEVETYFAKLDQEDGIAP